MKILGIETSSPLFSLSINEDEKIIYEIRKNRLIDTTNRDAQFFTEAKRLVEYFDKDIISAIAVSVGPGMFTSLRVGLSLAKGFALAQNIPLVGVNTLDVIGNAVSFLQDPVLATINAYHQEIYAAFYKKGERRGDYLLTTPAEIIDVIEDRTIICGSGVEVLKKYEPAVTNGNLHFIDDESTLPTASKVIKIAMSRIRDREFDDPEILEPFYIKKTDAERNYDKTDAH